MEGINRRFWELLCEQLQVDDCITDAAECLLKMANELANEVDMHEEPELIQYVMRRCAEKLASLGDAAMVAQQYDDVIKRYSAALSLDSACHQALFVRRSKAYVKNGLWEEGLEDANQAIELDESSPWGHERKYVALHGAGRHKEALDAWETMILKMSQSVDPDIRARPDLYKLAKEAIRSAVQDAIRGSPPVLINTTNGNLCNKAHQAAAFELSPIFADLLLSATTHIDHIRIEREVEDYYRYATFSHTWELDEPLYDKVMEIVVYELDESLGTHQKLQMFCKIVRDAGFHWAWSDTCCINRTDPSVLQEALVAMFKWYEGSALTVIFLRGVRSSSPRGALVKSVWNTRVWTFQEYHASKVVRFYTEDWKPYLNLDIPNHKESPEIISEMEAATGISARTLMGLRPGLDDIRQKLCLASRRRTTLVEDAAYSLLGIFSISMRVVYGEGDKALGKLLSQVLASSGDASILAWTGRSGSFNSCLPAQTVVFQELSPAHIPIVHGSQLGTTAAGPRFSASSAAKLFERLHELPVPSFAGRRMKLPCFTFKLGPLSSSRNGSGWVFRAQTAVLGTVEIATNENLSRYGSLCLVHPWIDFLLDRQPVGSAMEAIREDSEEADTRSPVGELASFPGPTSVALEPRPSRASHIASRLRLPFSTTARDATSLVPPSTVSPADKRMHALRMVARLKQPFGALLLTPDSGGVAAFRRVAAESLITVQVQETTPTMLNKLIECVHILDVL